MFRVKIYKRISMHHMKKECYFLDYFQLSVIINLAYSCYPQNKIQVNAMKPSSIIPLFICIAL